MATKASPKPKTSKNTTSSLDIKNKGTAKKTTAKKTAAQQYNLSGKTNNATNAVTKQYQGYQNQYNANVNKQVSNDVASSNAQYDASAKSAALRNAVQQKELQRQMYRNGITGGASETSLMNAANNYANQQTSISNNRAAAANKIRQQGEASKASFALSNAQNRDTAMQQAKDRVYNQYQNWLKRKDDLRKENKEDKRYKKEWKYKVKQNKLDRKERANERKYARRTERYQVEAQGYNTVKGYNKAIKKAKKKGNAREVAYLRQGKRLLKERNWNRKHSK